MSTVETTADLEQLVAELLEEAHALRRKYEEFSLYTEAKVAEFVAARRELDAQLQKAVKQRDHARARVAALEASRAVRIAVRIRKLLRR